MLFDEIGSTLSYCGGFRFETIARSRLSTKDESDEGYTSSKRLEAIVLYQYDASPSIEIVLRQTKTSHASAQADRNLGLINALVHDAVSVSASKARVTY